ncbi:MAG: pantoate--beta-alanine ligase [Planctomycetota bacterium]|jgi:pantoate--beta-alanine ligase
MRLVTDIAQLHAALQASADGPSLVPTMGALHDGHLALVRRARESTRPVVVTVFVNPTQFGPGEDFRTYPRNLEQDAELAAEHGADIVFAPDDRSVYPPDEDLGTPPLPEVATEPGLEDAFRPGHFEGVCQVVARLFDLVRPRTAVFGEKDYQQLLVVRGMVQAIGRSDPRRWGLLEIVSHPTVREPDGLAMSSRNVHLAPEERDDALGLHRALQAAAAANRPSTAESIMRDTLDAHGLAIDYAVVRDAATLAPVDSFARPTRGLVAARLGAVRLIDNRSLPVWS